ncbi:MAG: radical SAM family heme chaperone HemW [Clostridium sp.]|nr:radical SAM family heme chaperone HemW [Clostridium sp.]
MAGLYVHVPFCHSKCAYCDFYSMPGRENLRLRYAKAVGREFGMRCNGYGDFSTIYLGGGTPSILSEAELVAIVEALPAGAEEFTIEVNPEDVAPGKVDMWRRMGVNRVSMGVQSLCDVELRTVGRRHTAAQAADAFRILREGGIENISLDLIYGLPGQDLQSWERSLNGVISLGPEHLSAYSLTFEPRTRLAAMLGKGQIKEVDEDVAACMYEMLISATAAAGYEHYEISNFGKPGFHSRHNSSYWDSTPYLGLGPGAHSFDGINRQANPPMLKSYLQAIEGGMLACELEEESDADRFNDMVITSLRTSAGMDLAKVSSHRLKRLHIDAAPYIKMGSLIEKSNRLIIPEKKWLLADAVMRDLLQD